MRDVCKFRDHVVSAEDPHILEKNAPDHPSRAEPSSIGGDGLQWGSWFGFNDKGTTITSPALAFLVDIFVSTPTLIPPSERLGLGKSWFPTIALAIEFKAPIPRSSTKHSSHTVGVYSTGKFMNAGRHDAWVEVWTAPCNVGEGSEIPGWREEQVCLAVATQMAYTVPIEVNLARGKKKDVKL
ncbi:hypothetical protein H0H81_001942 [Sphagnurus paluster]|uniref:Acyl-CoA thioesterase-like C-terminal domain-containing protein n=1 Tax=Sphagnurus paluster TaxID=117069 RepID=A0A9P7K308_9AGAR|nr:hypothetical protein H0H81_001942 [Sphagnurus paluster]